MIRSTRILFCNEDHGTEITFPSLFFPGIDEDDFIAPPTVKQLRAEAKKAGWSFKNGLDLCDSCTERDAEEKLAKRQERQASR